MKEKYYLLITLLLISILLQSQQYFQKTVGGLNYEVCRSVKQTSDGGFIFAGYTTSFGFGSRDLFAIKTDLNGDTTWVRTYGGTGWDDGFDIIETVSGNFIFVGQTNSYGASDEVFLLNLDVNGNIVWSKTYGGTQSDRGIRVQQTSDLGYVIGCITYSYGNNAQFYLIKTDINGTVQWTSTYGGGNNDFLYGLDVTNDGGYILVGETSSFGQGSSDVFVVKVDASGTEQWSGSYGMAGSEWGYYIEQTSDGGYAINGSTNSLGNWEVLLLKLDNLGNLSWSKTYGSTSSDFGWEIHETSDAGLILMNNTNSFGYGLDNAYLIKTDSIGNLLWSKVYGGTNNDYFYSGCITNDNGFMLTGNTRSFGAGDYDSYYVRTDSLGNVFGCYTIDAATVENNIAFVQGISNLVYTTGVIENTVSSNSSSTASLIEDVCPCYFNNNLTVTDALCFGDNNGSASINFWGGTFPYGILWSTTSTNDTISNLIAGDYYVVVSDFYGCTTADTATISQPAQLLDSLIISNVNCFGGNDGLAIANVYGGTLPYQLLWSTTDTTDTISNITAGMYYLTITDNHLCLHTDSLEITEPPELFIDSILQTDVICYGDSTGTAISYNTGGTVPYYYLWSNGDTLNNAQNLSSGWIYITVTDNNACMKNDSIFIDQPQLLTDSIIYQNISCFGDSNGMATSIPSGGVMPYTFLWSTGNINDTVLNLPPATFFITVTDNNGCFLIDSIEITEPEILLDSIQHINVSCFGENNAYATVFPYGGTSPYYYEWSSDNDTLNFVDSLFAGIYYITVTDTNNCIVIDSIEITQPDLLTDSILNININCYDENNGSATIYAYGGTLPYYYEWSLSANDTLNFIDSLYAAWYYVTVTDTNNCMIIDSIEITQPDLLVVADSVINVLCFGGNDGMIFLNPSGGTSPYYYQWFSSNDSLYYIDSLYAGTYAVTITDNNGCIVMIPKIDVNEPNELVFYLDATMPLCYGDNNGYINSYVSGGTKPYNYLWSNSETDSVLSNILSDTFYLTVTDAHLCLATDTVFVGQPQPLSLTDSIYIVDYFGSIDLTVSGGTFPYAFLWSDDITYQNHDNLISGNYQVTVTDFNYCQIFGDYTIIIPFEVPTLITPNGDGYNDNWQITNINYYNNISIQIFNRWGDVVFEFSGSGFDYDSNRWDGTYNGGELPMGAYVYIIDLKNGIEPYNGVVTIKR